MARRWHLQPTDGEKVEGERRRGRGAVSNMTGRYKPERREAFDDGWESLGDLEPFRTEVREEIARTIIATNNSPDIGFTNPSIPIAAASMAASIVMRARATLIGAIPPGLDFETKLTAKVNALEALERELARPGYRPSAIMLGSNTDPYQPIERERRITRGILEAMDRYTPGRHRHQIASRRRDIDILSRLASRDLARVAHFADDARPPAGPQDEPRAATPGRRRCDGAISAAGVPVAVMTAPLIPGAQHCELESLLEAASRRAQARRLTCCCASPRNQPAFSGMAGGGISRPRGTGDVARALHAGRQGLCLHFRRTSPRHRPFIGADRQPFQARLAPLRPQPAPSEPARRSLHAAETGRSPTRTVLKPLPHWATRRAGPRGG